MPNIERSGSVDTSGWLHRIGWLAASCALGVATACGGAAGSRADAGALSGGLGTGGESDTGMQDPAEDSSDDTGPATPLADDAEVVSFDVATVMACGQSDSAGLVLRNIGTNTWSAADGYALVPLGVDPFGGTTLTLPDLIEVPPDGTFGFEILLQAPEQGGAHTTSWQMARGGQPFGAMGSASIEVDCDAPTPDLPDAYPTVEAVAAQYGHLLETNTYESCGEFVQHVLAALSAEDPEWGHVAKTAGEQQHTPPGFQPVVIDGYTITGFSHDAIFHRASYWQVDIIANAAANSDPDPAIHGPASITWGVIPQEDYRENNPWMASVPP